MFEQDRAQALAALLGAGAEELDGDHRKAVLLARQRGNARLERMMAQVQSRFAAANTTHDGKLTREQAQAGMPRVAQHFDEIDTQKAGFVTLAQIEDFMRARAAAR